MNPFGLLAQDALQHPNRFDWCSNTSVKLSCFIVQAQEVHAFLRKWLADNVSQPVSQQTRIIYGGKLKHVL